MGGYSGKTRNRARLSPPYNTLTCQKEMYENNSFLSQHPNSTSLVPGFFKRGTVLPVDTYVAGTLTAVWIVHEADTGRVPYFGISVQQHYLQVDVPAASWKVEIRIKNFLPMRPADDAEVILSDEERIKVVGELKKERELLLEKLQKSQEKVLVMVGGMRVEQGSLSTAQSGSVVVVNGQGPRLFWFSDGTSHTFCSNDSAPSGHHSTSVTAPPSIPFNPQTVDPSFPFQPLSMLKEGSKMPVMGVISDVGRITRSIMGEYRMELVLEDPSATDTQILKSLVLSMFRSKKKDLESSFVIGSVIYAKEVDIVIRDNLPRGNIFDRSAQNTQWYILGENGNMSHIDEENLGGVVLDRMKELRAWWLDTNMDL
ncbi:hypothetical protein V865_002688 [Kwoniella europaea PYCC6329]|uniref:Uncharacterized protein n=1 Tax=Kwoniella europaea PYCC6329 TaxID=1423913 RepID=A0AAX4KDX3_9TREE